MGVPDAESLQALLASLGDLGLDGEGDEGQADLAGILDTMMSQLVSKEVLYDPLKELSTAVSKPSIFLCLYRLTLFTQFPPYLENPPAPLTPAIKTQYESQLTCIHKILAIFDDPTYQGDDPVLKKQISDLMNEVCRSLRSLCLLLLILHFTKVANIRTSPYRGDGSAPTRDGPWARRNAIGR